jgi:hypothetical protein
LAALVVLLTQAARALPAVSQPGSQPTEAEVAAAVAKLKEDPDLAPFRKVRSLHWVDERPTEDPGWVQWIRDAFAWIAETGRLMLWVGGIVLAGMLALHIKRFLEMHAERKRTLRSTAPTHVRDLDIRPETLPDDIGAAALDLWERGQHRSALSLLYRGLLSRLAHVHGLPIRPSSTEWDCTELAVRSLNADRSVYVSRLVRVWQHAIYGGSEPSDEEMRALCAGFAPSLDRLPDTPMVEQPA